MQVTSVEIKSQVGLPDSNSKKKEVEEGIFESILKSIKVETSDQKLEKEEEPSLIDPLLLSQGIPVISTNLKLEEGLKDLGNLERDIKLDNLSLAKEVKVPEGIKIDLPNKLVEEPDPIESDPSKNDLIKSPDLAYAPLKEATSPKIGRDGEVNLNKESLPLTQGNQATKENQEKGLENLFKVNSKGKASDKPLENPIKGRESVKDNKEVTFFNLEKQEGPQKLEEVVIKPLETKEENLARVQDTMVKLFETSKEGETSRMKISLQPESLGKVDIGLKMENGRLTATILVENKEVRELFTNKLGDLNQSLLKQNILLDKIQVEVKSHGPNLNMDMNYQGNFKGGQKRQRENKINNIFKSEYTDLSKRPGASLEKGLSILA